MEVDHCNEAYAEKNEKIPARFLSDTPTDSQKISFNKIDNKVAALCADSGGK